MTATTIGIDYHIQELQQVATSLRNERTYGTSVAGVVSRIRRTVGSALVQLGTAVAADSRQLSTQAR